MKLLKPSSLEELEVILGENGIDSSDYGKGKAKDLEDLFQEIEEGESLLYLDDKTQEVIREVRVVNADVLYNDIEKGMLELFEEIQVFKIKLGDVLRYRIRKLPVAMMEKYKNDESGEVAMVRGMEEELNIDLSSTQYREIEGKSADKVMDSPSFPGIKSIYKLKFFEVLLTKEQFQPLGYVENQEKKSTYFKWRKV